MAKIGDSERTSKKSVIVRTTSRDELHRAWLGLRLRHPNLVCTLQVGPDWYETERVNGLSATTLCMQSSRVPAAIAARIIAQVRFGLQYMHGRRLAHGDVRPYNVTIHRDGRVRLSGALFEGDAAQDLRQLDELFQSLAGDGPLVEPARTHELAAYVARFL